MSLDEFISGLRLSPIYKSVYHFTDVKNLPGIRQHGILSKLQLERHLLNVPMPGGDIESRNSDKALGNYDSVSISLTPNHPMAHSCREDGRQTDQVYIPIDPDVLRGPGVVLCLGMANSPLTQRLPLEEGLVHINFEVIYTRHGQPFSEIRHIVENFRKYEVLIPKSIDTRYLGQEFKPKSK
jgi:hypothetical protein